MPILLTSLPVLAIVFIANLAAARGSARARTLFNLSLFLLNGLLVGGGLGILLAPIVGVTMPWPGAAVPGDRSAPGALIAVGLWGMLACLKPVRQSIARLIREFDPDSPVHTLALVGAGYLMGNAMVVTLVPGALDSLAESKPAVTLLDILAQQFLFVAIAFLGAGLFLRRDGAALRERLGLQRPTARQLLGGASWMLFFVFLQGCISFTWSLFDPSRVEQLSGINQALLSNFDTVGEWFVLAAAAGLGEESLFRGALQPVFGIVPTSIIFAVSHVQYGLSPATLAIFLLSVVLGIIRKRHNTTTAILVHAGYNFILGLLSLLAVYLQPFIEQAATALLVNLRF